MAARSSNTTWAVPNGRPRSPPANSHNIQTMAWRRPASSAFRGIIPVPWSCATSVSASCHDPGAPGTDDVSGVLHLGRVVRHDGYLSRPNPALHRFPDRPRVRSDRHRRPVFSLLHWNCRSPVVRKRKTPGCTAFHRRRPDVDGVEANGVRELLSGADSLCSVLHADAVAYQLTR